MNNSETNFVKQYEPGSEARVELKNGRILDVVNGRYFDAGTSVILRGGKIESMPGLAFEPTDVSTDFSIDLQGKTVLPTLYSTHYHGTAPTFVPGLGDKLRMGRYSEPQIDKDMAECLAHGITHIRNAHSPNLQDNRTLKQRISKGEIPGPRIQQAVVVGITGSYLQEKQALWMKVMAPPIVDPSIDYAGAVAFPINATEKQVRDAVDIAIDERGAEAIKVGDESTSVTTRKPVPRMTIEQLSAVADQARRRGLQMTMHHTTAESFRRGLEAGVSSLAHIPFEPLTQADAEAFTASDCIIEPTLSVGYASCWKVEGGQWNDHPEMNRLTEFRNKTYTYAAIADEYFVPELRAIVMNGYKMCTSGKPKMLGIIDMSEMLGGAFPAWLALFENFRLLYEQGARMATGNDTLPPCTPAMMGLELLLFDHVLKNDPDREPFSGAEAVKIATFNSAETMGFEKEFGSIEAGKTADLMILDGDPLEDFRLIGSRVAALFMDGKLVINNCSLELQSNGRVLN
jgi:imidazolonepropionase-like amidohydrolase